MAKTKATQFEGIPGLGWMFYNLTTPQGYVLWEGSMKLHTNERVALQGVAIREPREATKDERKAHKAAGGDRYEVKIVKMPTDTNPKWEHLGQFTMPAFGERRNQVVDTPVGKLGVWKQAPRGNVGACIRFRILRDATGANHASMPM